MNFLKIQNYRFTFYHKFSHVFDIEQFNKDRVDAYYQILKAKDRDAKDNEAVFAKDLYRLALKNNCIPKASLIKYRLSKIKRFFKHMFN